jgi:FtsP/CotA-like multicopper oxidase with cupredoxin domain/plastocyanin
MPEIWIQIENRPWNVYPGGVDRMTGETKTGMVDALILRRYKPPVPGQIDAWTVPDDRKVNPWDLNEPDPTVTKGTIPGPVVECNLGDTMTVHFRNNDQRTTLPIEYRLHSLHPHGFVFAATSDGAYPLSPPDPDPVNAVPPAEAAAWALVPGFTGAQKQGDRVPPGGTFVYTWQTIGWPTTAGVWLYHDHSIADEASVGLGAIGIIVIHNPADPDDVINQDLPGGSFTGSPVDTSTTPAKYRVPAKALYLQLFHEFADKGFCINGRQFLGNTPTMVAGPETLMRFGVVGMGSETHTFHIHGHRWAVTGPHGNTRLAIQGSVQDTPISQFEDTRVFGPANSFAFTIKEGSLGPLPSFMGPPPGAAVGEWHMHCHVLDHMMAGMMGSLLVVNAGDEAKNLPKGVPLPPLPGTGPAAMTATVKSAIDALSGELVWKDAASGTPETTIKVGGTVAWDGTVGHPHTVESDGTPAFAGLTTPFSTLQPPVMFMTVGDFKYHCGIHGGDPTAKTGMWGIIHVVP